MPLLPPHYSDTEIAALVNDVAGRFGRSACRIALQDVGELRKQASN